MVLWFQIAWEFREEPQFTMPVESVPETTALVLIAPGLQMVEQSSISAEHVVGGIVESCVAQPRMSAECAMVITRVVLIAPVYLMAILLWIVLESAWGTTPVA